MNDTTTTSTREISITTADLPLHCPRGDDKLWSSHPRVFLAIDETPGATATCPYCGARYRMTPGD